MKLKMIKQNGFWKATFEKGKGLNSVVIVKVSKSWWQALSVFSFKNIINSLTNN